MKVSILTIGDEILIGQIVDTNSAWISQKLTLAGFDVVSHLSVADNARQIEQALDELFSHVDIVLTSGGIGPTKDDITKQTLCTYFNTELVFSESVLKNIQELLKSWTNLNELTRNQAYVPRDCTVIQNKVGTAPITWFEKQSKVLVSMPGVPLEMKWAMEQEIIPRLTTRFRTTNILKQTFIITGYTESALALALKEFENTLPTYVTLAYLPSPGVIRLRLMTKEPSFSKQFHQYVNILREQLHDNILAEDDKSPEQLLYEYLLSKQLTLSTAESCTGGSIAQAITCQPGASSVLRGSIVAYQNSVKESVLQVSSHTISTYGVVSKQVVEEMAKGVSNILSSDCSIATSGILGPGGGTDQTPVGTVWIATKVKDKLLAKEYRLGNIRNSNMVRASNLAMIQLIEMINKEPEET